MHRLPNGAVTSSIDVYIKEWKKLTNRLEELLDVDVIGFDPDMLVRARNHPGARSVEMPLWIVRRIIALTTESLDVRK